MEKLSNMPHLQRKRAMIARDQAEAAYKNDDLKDLYIFGYQCKLFRDDERATYIDQGMHLIPWMDNDRLTIDRYDGRGHLHDLTEYDADLCRSSIQPLTEEEQQIEALCDEERYLELNSDILEKMLYEEEELKRLNEALATDGTYTAVGFSYGDSNGSAAADSQNNETVPEEDEDTKPYVPIPELQLPASIKPPTTAKMHAIIERTAVFIAKHGVQMEIMMKTKQKDNPQFGFLNYEDDLNAYYKHLVNAIKHLKYIPVSMAQQSSNTEHAYLHPSLASSSIAEKDTQPPQETTISSQEFLDSISAKLPAGQIANTPYAKLLSNLSKHAFPVRTVSPKPPDTAVRQEKSLPSIKSAPSSLQHLGTSYQYSRGIIQPPVPGLEPVSLPSAASSACVAETDNYQPHEPIHGPVTMPPAPDIQPIIDKMADYVARNGPEFEIVVRRRNDARFHFIEPDDPHYAYYTHKKNLFVAEIESRKVEEERERVEKERLEKERLGKERLQKEAASRLEMEQQDRDDKLQIKGVSFMIKAKEEEPPVLQSTALPYESSDEDDEDDDESDSLPAANPPSLPFAPPSRSGVVLQSSGGFQSTALKPSGGSSSRLNTHFSTADNTDVRSQSMADLSIPLPAEPKKYDKLADKLAAATRDKMSAANRDKLLQAQRKRRATAFLTLLNKPGEPAPADAQDDATSSTGIMEGPSSPLSIPTERSRSSTPATFIQIASRGVSPAIQSVQASSQSPSPFIERFLQATVASRTSPLVTKAPSPLATKLVSAATKHRHRHRSKSPRRHKHRSRSHSHRRRSKSRSKSPSKKHKKHNKKLPSAYVVKRSVSPSSRKLPEVDPSSRSKHGAGDAADDKQRSKHAKSHRSSSSKRHHKKSDDSERHRQSKKHHHTKRSRRRSHSSLSSSSSLSPPRQRVRKLSDNLIDLTLNDKDSDSIGSISSDSSSPINVNKSSGKVGELSEVEALLRARRQQLLKEDIVILD